MVLSCINVSSFYHKCLQFSRLQSNSSRTQPILLFRSRLLWLDASDEKNEQIAQFSDGSPVEWLENYQHIDNFHYNTGNNYQLLHPHGYWYLDRPYRRSYMCETPRGKCKCRLQLFSQGNVMTLTADKMLNSSILNC